MKKEAFWNAACKVSRGTQFMCHAIGRKNRDEFERLLDEHGISLSGNLACRGSGGRRKVGIFGLKAYDVRFMFLLFLFESAS